MTNNNHPVDIPKTYTVAYFDEAEWNKDLTPVEIAQQELINTSYQNELEAQEKGHGPCSYSNPNCTCYINQGLIPLHLACPATSCTNKQAYQWIHNSCNGRIYISTSAYLKCMSCSITGHIKNWSFACSIHPGNFLPTTSEDCIDALGTVLKLYPNKPTEIKKIIRMISNKLMDDDGGF